jgi:exopolyphosphatase/guanosine-5'-triphosphate,3'-diphosphate pyrophosphatase
MNPTAYYLVVILLGVLNVALAGVAYAQRARQIRGGRLHEQQLRLAESRNELAESRLRRLDDQIELMGQIRDVLAAAPTGRGAAVGVIDVGSATMRLTVARRTDGEWEHLGGERAFLRLGAEIEREGGYSDDVLDGVGAEARRFMGIADELGCERLAIVVTAPGRSGANPSALLERLTVATGRTPCLLTPAQEASLTFAGAATGMLGGGEAAVVCDVGGGSTEVSYGTLRGGVDVVGSFDIGAVRLAERAFRHDPPTPEELEAARVYTRSRLAFDRRQTARVALVTGGCAHALAKLGVSVFEPVTFEHVTAKVMAAGGDEMKGVPRHRRRALPAGIVIFERLHQILGMPLTVAAGGLRRGVLCELDDDRFHDNHAGAARASDAAEIQPVAEQVLQAAAGDAPDLAVAVAAKDAGRGRRA